jgi:hypothetical protein
MASLWFKTGTTMIFDALRPLTRFKAVMAERMQSVGFTGIVIDDFQVAGRRDGGWTAMHPVLRSDMGQRKEYVFVVMCAADTEDVAARNAGDVNAMIGWTDDLWQ